MKTVLFLMAAILMSATVNASENSVKRTCNILVSSSWSTNYHSGNEIFTTDQQARIEYILKAKGYKQVITHDVGSKLENGDDILEIGSHWTNGHVSGINWYMHDIASPFIIKRGIENEDTVNFGTTFFDHYVNVKSLYHKVCDYHSDRCGTEAIVNNLDSILAKVPDCKE